MKLSSTEMEKTRVKQVSEEIVRVSVEHIKLDISIKHQSSYVDYTIRHTTLGLGWRNKCGSWWHIGGV